MNAAYAQPSLQSQQVKRLNAFAKSASAHAQAMSTSWQVDIYSSNRDCLRLESEAKRVMTVAEFKYF